ncbi:helix-turn-helix domain-containing protein [Micromonospora chokoriensis]|uniref:helix-turn-helix domain-containing protein n=1 Tax=Micromonospora chokoriensis TaxID=356851 RepID=UPI0004C44118|nr:helix-turn-helix transcriptional regulator [Micromonospora chokoriensis]
MDRPAHAGVEIDGPKIRELRKLRGESVTSLASTCGITRQYLSQIERGDRRRVSPPVYAKICNALKLSGDRQRRTLLKVAA